MRGPGRSAHLSLDGILTAGRTLGLRGLSLNAVASHLGVTAAALYRYVNGRRELERLIGENIVDEFEMLDDPEQSAADHLISFARSLRRFTLAQTGLAEYLQELFPRGEASVALFDAEVHALELRGYTTETARTLVSTVLTATIGLIATEAKNAPETQEAAKTIDVEPRHSAQASPSSARGSIARGDTARGDTDLDDTDVDVTDLADTDLDLTDLAITALVRGLIAAAPPERSLAEVAAALSAP
ncbi:hypothetical protein [Humidisolicoccus flavus]|uniref:hypothetical protein n=1 Tax=Humidisolicoccus flavus TaxID=3111414 RepID=UPI0032481AA2